MLTVAVVIFSGWLLAATLGTWTYFAAQNPSPGFRVLEGDL